MYGRMMKINKTRRNAKPENVKISMVTTCKGRLSYLRESIKTWINLDYDNYEIIVVDYDCPDGTQKYVEETYIDEPEIEGISPPVRVVKVNNRPYFNLNDARNRGADAASGELIFMIDSDVYIRDKRVLKKINIQYRQGTIFFCNPAVLTTNVTEGTDFYRFKYGVEVTFPAFLPCHCKDSGLTGTACFVKERYEAGGKYDPEINKYGWGSDDIEFYLRYLNYHFYRTHREKERTIAPQDIPWLLDRAHRLYIRPFGDKTFRLQDNTEEEKEKNYPNPKQDSNVRNKKHIRAFFENPHPLIPRHCIQQNSIPQRTKSIMAYGRYKSYPLPTWFDYWYFHWHGVALFNENQLEKSKREFKQMLDIETTPLNYRWHALFYIATIYKHQNKKGWQTKKRSAWEQAKRQRRKSPLEKYNIASFLKSLEELEEAERLFRQLTRDSNVDNNLRAGAFFHRGEMALRNRKSSRAKRMFRQTLKYNPGHRKASEYLKPLENKT
jgi:glycosyltransferase involved in cell wall biosynthesis